jgi:tetratricopeptide (TPR) repeat protein
LKKIFFLIILVTPFIFYIIQTIKRDAEWENPIRFYEINIQRQGVGSIIYNNLGRAYFNKGEYAKAKEMYEKALEVDPTMYQAWYNLGNLYLQLAYFDKALSAYERTLAINKYFVPAYHNIAVVYDRQGKQAEAIDFLERVSREVFPIPPMGIWYDLAVFSLKDGQKEKAHYYFNKVFEKNPDDPMVKQLEELMK